MTALLAAQLLARHLGRVPRPPNFGDGPKLQHLRIEIPNSANPKELDLAMHNMALCIPEPIIFEPIIPQIHCGEIAETGECDGVIVRLITYHVPSIDVVMNSFEVRVHQ